MSINFETEESLDLLDYWAKLKETCEKNQKLVNQKCTGNEDFDEEERRIVKMEFIKEQLVEMTKLTDNKIESIFKIAQEEESDNSAHLQTSEFLDQLIEICNDLCWLILRIPEDSIGKRLHKKYLNGFDEMMKSILGLERIWWSIRRGYIGLPRNRDYSTLHLFINLNTEAKADARDQFNNWINDLNDSIKGLKSSNISKGKTFRIIMITFNILKKIRLNNLFVKTEIHLINEILKSTESLILLTNSLILQINQSTSSLTLNQALSRNLDELIKLLEVGVEAEADGKDEWFEKQLKEFDEICEKINEMNPIR